MACKCCGENGLKDTSVSDLVEEIKRRKAMARTLKEKYFAEVYPTRSRDSWFMIASFVVAFFGAGLIMSPIGRYIGSHVGDFYELVVLLLLPCVFFVLFSPGIYYILKEGRVYRSFKEEHPEHAEVLAQS